MHRSTGEYRCVLSMTNMVATSPSSSARWFQECAAAAAGAGAGAGAGVETKVTIICGMQ